MKINSADFLISNTNINKCPKPNKPEYAFTGRSNVGKSSLINMLVDRKKLAKTSVKPGKTQLINHFMINNEWYLVDLPGYGYAKVSKTDREKWLNFIHKYILNRPNLICLFLLIDSRHHPQQNDLDFMEWLSVHSVPFVMVFTKTDKLSKNQLEKNIAYYKKKMLENWEFLPEYFITSSVDKQGKDEVLSYIEKLNPSFID